MLILMGHYTFVMRYSVTVMEVNILRSYEEMRGCVWVYNILPFIHTANRSQTDQITQSSCYTTTGRPDYHSCTMEASNARS